VTPPEDIGEPRGELRVVGIERNASDDNQA